MAIVKEVVANASSNNQLGASIDPNCVYLFGHSIGGTGVWQLGMRNPDVFAANVADFKSRNYAGVLICKDGFRFLT
jgi:predicted peptidase